MIISVTELKAAEKRFEALGNTTNRGTHFVDSTEKAIAADVLESTSENILTPDVNLGERKRMLVAVSPEPIDFALERAIGQNDSVYSNFTDLIHAAKQKVGRVVVKSGTKILSYATGFLVSKNLVLTNWHVFNELKDVGDSEIQFRYELDILGNPGDPVRFSFRPDIFFHSDQTLDYCLLGVAPTDISGTVSLSEMGYIFLDPTLGKIGNEGEEALNIIHHPNGDFMQLSIRENLFKKISSTSIWYETDTAPGSSGSPVFNDQWQVVALHHMGVARRNNTGQYLDKNGDIIPIVKGSIDSSKLVWDANEGIRISVILNDLLTKYTNNEIVKGLLKKPNTSLDTKPPANASEAETADNNSQKNTLMNENINVTFPASLVSKNGVVNFSINQGNASMGTVGEVSSQATSQVLAGLDENEIKSLEKTDFSLCKGYQSGFLGTKNKIDFPKPQQAINKFISTVNGTDGILLKYYGYSVIFHSVRMMPLISGINVDGNPAKRLDKTKRSDVWLRDNRLSFDIQLDDAYYKKSGFDRGHMSRREDANWGNTAEDALRNANFTCMYTNACPQVPALNQSKRKGLWGKLEMLVLEKGAVKENEKTAKISVFNGPIFQDDDPVFRGIQIPVTFFKIVVWPTNAGGLKATAFKLTQQGIMGNIDFAKEQLDINQNEEFSAYQCSIKWLQEATKIDFSQLLALDTFEGDENEAHEINNENEIVAHISKVVAVA